MEQAHDSHLKCLSSLVRLRRRFGPKSGQHSAPVHTITSNRPYKAGWDPAESVARMVAWEGHFDTLVLQTFIKTLGIYPVGSLVRMESGKLGVVVEQNRHKLTSPKVKLFFSTKTNLPFAPVLVDLADRQTSDRITAREPREKWSFPYLDELWTV